MDDRESPPDKSQVREPENLTALVLLVLLLVGLGVFLLCVYKAIGAPG